MSVEVVAEIGSNWQGSLTTMARLATSAAWAGADTLKVQHYPPALGPHPFTARTLREAQRIADEHGLQFLASVFDQQTLEQYVDICEPARVKIASPELTRDDLLKQVGGLEVILSTGMSTVEQINHADHILGTATVTLLHCTSAYPAPPEEMNLRAIHMLRRRFGRPVGLSDHSTNPIVAPVAAVALGAVMVEKHLTLDRDAPGPDHPTSIEPEPFRAMVDAIRLADQMAGDGRKRLMPSEDPTDRR